MGRRQGGGMGQMMQQMGVPKPTELYPTLMSLPDLPLEKRREIQAQAHERMKSGAALMSDGLEKLSRAAPTDDFSAMQEATATVREGLAQFESGLAAHRALAEGKAPRNVALQWFKREMNLLGPPNATAKTGTPGWFHFFIMVLLGTFAAAMIWMYFLKMRRAAALLERLSSAEGVAAAAGPPKQPAPAGTASAPAPSSPTSPVSPPGPPPPAAADPASPAPVRVPASGKPAKWSGALRVARIFQETPDVKTFRMVNPQGGEIPFTYRPGQYLTLTVSPEGKEVKRSYTIASAPTQRDYVEITVKREEHGLVSRYLHDKLREGDELKVSAPSGRFTFDGTEHDSIVLIGGGVGITPMMSVIRYLTDRAWPGEIFLLYSTRTSREFIFREELEYLQRRHPNLNVVATMTRSAGTVWMGLKGRFNKELIAGAVPDIASRRVHICGPPGMMEAIKAMLLELGVPPEQVKTEAFGTAKRQPKPPPAPGAEKAPAAAATVTFAKSGKSAPLAPDVTVLEAAEAVGVEIDNSCRSGTCGSCKVKLLSGTVTMEVEDALEPEDKAQNIILACQAKSSGDVSVEA